MGGWLSTEEVDTLCGRGHSGDEFKVAVPGRVFSLHIAHFGVRLPELARVHKDW